MAMGLLGSRYAGIYEGHVIEIVQDHLSKTLRLVVDGVTVASEDRAVPRDITLVATFEHGGIAHRLVGRSIHRGPAAKDSIEIDGKPFSITRK